MWIKKNAVRLPHPKQSYHQRQYHFLQDSFTSLDVANANPNK